MDSRGHQSEEWTDLVDRGGLVHLSDDIFLIFAAMEAVVKTHFKIDNPSLLKELKEKMKSDVLQNENVLFYWSMIAANWVENEAEELLSMIVDQWITIRGFSFSSSFNEKYKREQAKTLEKSKGIRKNLIGKVE